MASSPRVTPAEGPLRVGICGLGTVAQGVLELIRENGERINVDAGRPIEVVRVASRSAKPEVDLLGAEFSTDLDAVADDDSLDVILELIGGEDAALTLVRDGLRRGRAVVTANKAILAAHGDELASLVEAHGGRVWVESEIGEGSIFYFLLPLSEQDDPWSDLEIPPLDLLS